MDRVTAALLGLRGELPSPRILLDEEQKDALITAVGLGAVKDILKAQKELSYRRIPFLFSSIDTQAVVDILANDMAAAMKRAEARKSKGK